MKATDAHLDTTALGEPARDRGGAPTIGFDVAVQFVRHHIDIEKVRTGDYDQELWQLWRDETGSAAPGDTNGDVLERVLARVRTGD